jgi:MFS family permease
MVAFFNQWSGINFILYYAPEILERAGLAAKDSLANSIAIGGVNLVFTFVGLYLIDRLGRKTLLIVGSFGYIISLAMVAFAFLFACRSRFSDDVPVAVHRFSRHRAGRSYLGVYIRNISKQSTGTGTIVRSKYTLGICCNHNIAYSRIPG